MGWRSAIFSENVHTDTPEKRMQEALKSQVAGHQQDSGKFGNTAVHCSRCSNQITTEGAQHFLGGRGTVSWSIQPTDLAKVAMPSPCHLNACKGYSVAEGQSWPGVRRSLQGAGPLSSVAGGTRGHSSQHPWKVNVPNVAGVLEIGFALSATKININKPVRGDLWGYSTILRTSAGASWCGLYKYLFHLPRISLLLGCHRNHKLLMSLLSQKRPGMALRAFEMFQVSALQLENPAISPWLLPGPTGFFFPPNGRCSSCSIHSHDNAGPSSSWNRGEV